MKNVATAIALYVVPADEVSLATSKLQEAKPVPLPQTINLHQVITDTTNVVHHSVLSCDCAKPLSCTCYSRQTTRFETDVDASVWVNGPSETCDTQQSCDQASACRQTHFATLLNALHGCESYDMLRDTCSKFEDNVYTLSVYMQHTTVSCSRDKTASTLMPDDVSCTTSRLVPVSVMADGNCLLRSGSVLAFGYEDFADEIRARIVIELVMHEHHYLDGSFLRQGTCIDDKDGECLTIS